MNDDFAKVAEAATSFVDSLKGSDPKVIVAVAIASVTIASINALIKTL